MVREVNEDAFLARDDIGLWVVADGMGGHSAGDVASRMVVDALRATGAPGRLSEFVDAVEDRLARVNAELRRIAGERSAQTVGTTVVALLARRRHAVCLWAGDSRLYRYRAGVIEQLSSDHALVKEMVERGELTESQAAHHPQGNLVTRAVGAAERLALDVDLFDLAAGDIYVLCSDGLDKELSPEEIAEVLGREDPEPPSSVLVDIALSRGSRDNVTVVTVEFTEGERTVAPEDDTVPGFTIGFSGTAASS